MKSLKFIPIYAAIALPLSAQEQDLKYKQEDLKIIKHSEISRLSETHPVPLNEKQMKTLIEKSKSDTAISQLQLTALELTQLEESKKMIVIHSNNTNSKSITDIISADKLRISKGQKEVSQDALIRKKREKGLISEEEFAEQLLSNLYPITTENMAPGKMPRYTPIDEKNEFAQGGRIAIVGDDQLSKTWLKDNADELGRMATIVFVTNVKNHAAFMQIRNLAPKLHMQPLDATEVGKKLNINKYPIMVTKKGIFQ